MTNQAESAPLRGVHATGSRHLQASWLWTARTLWFAFFALMLVLNVAAIAAHIEHYARGRGVAGLEAVANEGQEYVLQVDPQGVAAQAGLQQGELLVAIEGVPVQPDAPYHEVNRKLRGPVGASLTISVQDQNGTVRQYTLTLAEEELLQAWRRLGVPVEITDIFFVTLEAFLVLGWLLAAALIFWRRSDDWLVLFLSVTLALVTPQLSYNWYFLIQAYPHWEATFGLLSTVGVACSLLNFYLLPDGRFIPRWTVALAVVWVLWRLAMELFPTAPFSILGWPNALQTLVWLGFYGTGVFAQAHRYRRMATSIERQQIKWVAFGLTIAVLVNLAWSLAFDLFPLLNQPGLPNLLIWLVGRPLYVLGMMLLPISFGIAVFRYRLWEIDLIINRTLVYGVLTAIVAGLIGALSSLFQKLFVTVTGSESDLATVFAALVVGAAIAPLRTSLQALVDKAFKDSTEPAKRLAGFQEQVQHRLNPLHPKIALRRLLHESVTAFAAQGGVVYWGGDNRLGLTYTQGQWTGEAVVKIPLQTEHRTWGYLALGPRRNQRRYSRKDGQILQKAAHIVVLAIEQDMQLEGES